MQLNKSCALLPKNLSVDLLKISHQDTALAHQRLIQQKFYYTTEFLMKKNLHILICLEQTTLLDTIKQERSFLESHLQLKCFGIVKKAEEYLNSIFHELVSLSLMICSASFSETDGVVLIVRLND